MLADANIHKSAVARQADITVDRVLDLYTSIVAGFLSAEHMQLFLEAAVPVIRAGMGAAHSVSSSAYARTRRNEGERGRFQFPRQRTPNDEQIASSLKYLGFVAPRKRQQEGEVTWEVPLTDDDPVLTERALGGGVGRRIVQQAMDSMVAAQRADERALGWARVTQGDSRVCYFCSMLESRGAVYKAQSWLDSDSRFRDNLMPPEVLSGELGAKTHDHCRCVLTPIFTRDSDVIENADKLYSTWLEVQRRYARVASQLGWDMKQVWRLWWEGRIDDAIVRKMS